MSDVPDIDALIGEHLEGMLTEVGRRRLETWLAEDPAHRRRFLRLVMDHAALTRLAQAMAAKPPTVRTRRILMRRRPQPWLAPSAIAAGLLLAIGGWWLWSGSSDRPRPTVPGQVLAADKPAATVSLPLLASASGADIAPGRRLSAGTRLATDAGGTAMLRWDDGSVVRLAPDSQVEIGAGVGVHLVHGRLAAEIEPQPASRPARFTTGEADVLVVGTALAIASMDGESSAEVSHGRVRVRRIADAAEVSVGAGECVAIAAGLDMRVRPLGSPAGTVYRVAPGAPWPDQTRLQPGDAIDLAPGTHAGAWRLTASGTAMRPIAIHGAGMDATVIDAEGVATSGEHNGPRAALQIDGSHVAISDLAMRGARNTTANAAGVRMLTTADAVSLRSCRIGDCDLGVTSDPGSGQVLIEDCIVSGNGAASTVRTTHNLKLANRHATVRGCRIEDARFGANIEVHDGRYRLIGNRITAGAEGEIGIELSGDGACRLEAIGNLIVGRARAAASNHGRFIYLNRLFGAVGTVQLRLDACTLVAGEPLNWMIDAPGCEVVLNSSIISGSVRLATPGTRITGQGDCIPEQAEDSGLTQPMRSDPRFADPAAGDFRLLPTSPCLDASVQRPPSLEPPGAATPARPRTASGGIGAY